MDKYFLYIEIAWFTCFFVYFLARLGNGLDICKEQLPKQFAKAIIVIIAVVSILFSVHSTIYAQYDEVDESGKYFWGNLSHLNAFPLDQLGLNHQTKESMIKLDIPDHQEKHCYYFLIDRTKSTQPDERIAKLSAQLRTQLVQRINTGNNSCLNTQENIDKLALSDLIILSFIQSLFASPVINKQKEFVIYFYNGDKQCISLYDHKITISHWNFCRLLKDYLNRVNNLPAKGKHSNFSYIFDCLNHENALGNLQQKENSLSIISDFIHDTPITGSSFVEVNKSASQLSSNYIAQVNLIKVTGKQYNAESAETINNILSKHFSEVYLYNYIDEELMLEEHGSELISYIFSLTKKDTTQSLKLYFPYTNGKVNNSCMGILSSKKTNNSDKFFFCLRNETEQNTTGTQISFKEPQININTNKPVYYELNPGKQKWITGKNFSTTCSYFLEVRPSGSFYKIQIPIQLLEKLPRSICHLLILLFLSFFTGIGFIGLYTLTRYLVIHKKESVLEKGFIGLIILLHCFINLYLIAQCIVGFIYKETIWASVFFLLFLAVLLFTGIKFWRYSLHKVTI